MGLKIGRTVLGNVETNCYFVYNDKEKKALVFDPGDDGNGIYEKLKNKGFTVAGIALTHGHFDNILGVKALKERSGCLVYAPCTEEGLLLDPEKNCTADIGRPLSLKADVFLRDGEVRDIDGISFKTLLTPGHTGGSACFYFEEEGFLISGDTLFAGSVGRTDLPTGNMGELVRSIKDKLMTLPDETVVYPGHGPETTLGDEKKYNPFL